MSKKIRKLKEFSCVDEPGVLHLKSRSVTSFSFGVEKNSMAPAHSFVAAWPPLPRMTRTNPLDIHGSRKIGAVQLTGAVPVPTTGNEPKEALGRTSSLSCWHGHASTQPRRWWPW